MDGNGTNNEHNLQQVGNVYKLTITIAGAISKCKIVGTTCTN